MENIQIDNYYFAKQEFEKYTLEYSTEYMRLMQSTLSIEERWNLLRPYTEKIQKAHCKMIETIPDEEMKFSNIDEEDDIYSIEEFINSVKSGSFRDNDGTGYLIKNGKQTDIYINPSDFETTIDVSRYEGVVWYNK